MARLSDLGKIFSFASDAHTIGDIAMSLFGKTRGSAEDDGKSKSWLKGLFDNNDEVVVSVTLGELAKEDAEGVSIFLRFLHLKFPKGKTWSERVSNVRTRNAFMHFIVNHGNKPPIQHKVKEFTKKDKTGAETVTIEWGTSPAGANESLEFIKRCIATIRSAPTEAKGRNKLMKELEAINAPTPSDTLTKGIEQAAESAGDSLKSADILMAKRIRHKKRNRNIVRRALDIFF